jgi:Ca2+-binding RTX toxin-like protein
MKNRSKAAAVAAGLVVLAAQALAIAPGAQAATGTVVDRNLDTYTVFAQDGKANAIQISTVGTPTGTNIVVEDAGDIVIAGNDCTTVTSHRVECVQSGNPQLIISAGDLNDTLTNATPIPAVMQGGTGDDTITAGDAVGGTLNILSGDAGADTLTGGSHTDQLFGGADADQLLGEDGNDTLDGGPGNDTLTGGPGTDTFRSSDTGPDGADVMNGNGDISTYASRTTPVTVTLDGVANDGAPGEGDNNIGIIQLVGGSGRDVLTGGATRIIINGGPENDVLEGGPDSDILAGEEGDDTLTGAGGADVLRGENGNDVLNGVDDVEGNDQLNGGNNTDACTSDAGDVEVGCES